MSANGQQHLPRDWLHAALADIATIVLGQSPPGETYNDAGDGLPFFQGKAEFGEVYPTPVKWCSAPNKIAEPDDVLISVRAPVGPTNLSPSVACIGRGLVAIRPLLGISSRYILYALRNQEPDIALRGAGSTFGAITGIQLRGLVISVAPLPEQHRIVAEIEKHLTRLDAAIVALKRARANLKRYRASVLKAACEGRLVPTEAELARAEGCDYEPAAALLERILRERRARREAEQLAKMEAAGKPPKDDRWKANYRGPEAPDTRGLPDLPEGWLWATVDQVSLLIQYGTSARTAPEAQGVPVLRMGNISEGRLDVTELKFLPDDHKEFPELLLSVGDLLFNRTNSPELVGKSAVYKGIPSPCSFASYLIRVRLAEPCVAEFLANFLNSVHGRSWVRTVVSQQVGQANVNGTKLRALNLPLPPEAEQRRIVAEVERRLSVAGALQTAIENSLQRVERLRQAVLKRAFEGKLVPQDPDDEPASVLLERIRAERAAPGEGVSPRRRSRRAEAAAAQMRLEETRAE